MILQRLLPAFLWVMAILPFEARALDMTADQSKKLEVLIKQVNDWAKNPELVAAVRDYNSKGRASTQDMDQDKWATLTIMDPIVKDLRSNATAKFLQNKKSEVMSEGFVSGADGTKVGFLSKTSNWSHKGKPKHDEPMAGKTWIGQPEKDASTGLSQVQFALPILDAGQPIGSLVIGVAVNKL
ncbi:MAG TPA: PDC sensor domain-containing protein [Oligoflexus sp.]|uniref:PDC sensor domain-containing protein n=1 Tax=Oligoflexus sp. TaxID=1971216 RepID=UPI002D2AC113|nr:PDC sensor domain-containing protein [Oligoflexus sp.]HYX39274.1 PDC sensor domain-containing protein [Oligoflexus sp.]